MYDFSGLELTNDQQISIDQNFGDLHLRLPGSGRVRVNTEVGLGSASLMQPDLASLVTNYPELADLVGTAAFPTKGSVVTPATLSELFRESGSSEEISPTFDVGSWPLSWSNTSILSPEISSFVQSGRRLDLGDSGPILTINLRVGLGSAYLYYPVWAGDPPQVMDPTQVCIEAGGSVGVMQPCNELPVDRRVAVCFPTSDSQYPDGVVVDCREAPFGTSNSPVCWNRIGKYELCSTLEIEASGGVLKDPPQTSIPDPYGGYPPEVGGETVPPLVSPPTVSPSPEASPSPAATATAAPLSIPATSNS